MKITAGTIKKLLKAGFQEEGYTLPEILVALGMASMLGALALASNPFGQTSKLNNAGYQLEGILQQTRTRAIATTSAIRIEPDPDNPSTALKIESATTRGCEAISALSAAVESDETQIPVVSTRGFSVGDKLKIGSDDTDNQVIAIDDNSSLLTLGQAIGSTQPEDAVVELAQNWAPDGAVLAEDLTFNEPMEIASNVTNDEWRLCFDSRGFATLFDAQGVVDQDLELTISDTSNDEELQLNVLRGGAITKPEPEEI
ncbi:prepilin-type cleavage/methylation domain-containing protein [Cyanobacterium stanieri LEGE 03274]|uniref:Prepilin-type cleavage/methylation domain-containing protein n=1 Tax=Cyanobacterium stanieri LEGE 03274 TaxID=1828756 RepID=A0ABR9V2L7_9CHRO|nr:prepilin-type cleavage/methylation domain-containing protein [Cyanobacterium stanieri]MBE9222125.1 prepilin-type cleavage/methylation domain-containing protein [Cyanobacterium stanieri LEGE 03274]